MNKIFIFLILWSLGSLGIAQDNVLTFKDQKISSQNWEDINLGSSLSFKNWKDQSDERDQVPEWETIVKERSNREMVGRVFQCVGQCRVDRGQGFFNASFRTSLYEGDEFQTIGESYAWIFLFDGTMVRLSPESSINFNEINIGVKENFISARINMGNVLWLSRSEAQFLENNIRETDVLFFPVSLYEANPVPDKRPYREDDLIELVEEKQSVLKQYENLNGLISENNKWTKNKETYAFLVTPNVTIMGTNPSVEIVSLLGGKTYFKKRSSLLLGLKGEVADHDLNIQMRGFENTNLNLIEPDVWLSVDEKGRGLSKASENTYWLMMGEFITKRIPTLMVARELMLQKYSEFAFREKYDPLKLAREDGYRLWGKLKSEEGKKEDLQLRLDYLLEYFRRAETTNLLMAAHFRERLKERGESLRSTEYGNYFFIKALDRYYSYEDYADEDEKGVLLNSTTKSLWKRMHGIK